MKIHKDTSIIFSPRMGHLINFFQSKCISYILSPKEVVGFSPEMCWLLLIISYILNLEEVVGLSPEMC